MKLTFIKQHHWRRSLRAFSLVELSIVLVILGLLVGGVLSGRSLIRAAEMRTVTVDAQRFMAATHTFRDKYFALPGDMTNATAFWGVAAGTGNNAACRDFKSSTPATCNGDGNGRIGLAAGSYEYFRYWQQLANAALIEGAYSGTIPTNPSVDYDNENSPQVKAGREYWAVFYSSVPAGNLTLFAGDYGNVLFSADDDDDGSIFKPEEIWNLDKKIDDGIPNSGKLWSSKGNAAFPCTTRFDQPTDTGAEYNLDENVVACTPYYIVPF